MEEIISADVSKAASNSAVFSGNTFRIATSRIIFVFFYIPANSGPHWISQLDENGHNKLTANLGNL
jgi:hypothetical protein